MTTLKKLNLGSGPTGLPGWLNYDWGILPFLSKHQMLRKTIIMAGLLPKNYDIQWPKISLVDIRKKFPLKDNSVKYIYCSHVLEHFEKWEGEKILRECYRVLSKNSVMRIVLPDLTKILNIYSGLLKSAPGTAALKLCRLWYGFDKDIPPQNFIQKISRIFIREHQWHYDFPEIENSLSKAGFKKVYKFSFSKGKVPDLDQLDLECHADHSMYIEAYK